VRIEADSHAGAIQGDAQRVKQIVSNLVANAIKFTPHGGDVFVTATRNGKKVTVCVRDTGEGIEPRLLHDIFEPFSQADTSPSREHGGLGLGLAIAKQLVAAHGGRIHAESPGVGHGATFVVELPLESVGR